MKTTIATLHGAAIRPWDSPELKAVYWAGAHYALNDAGRAWYSIGAADALTDVLDSLPDSVIEHHPGGLKSLQHARRAWIDKNHRLGDAYARRVGLLK